MHEQTFVDIQNRLDALDSNSGRQYTGLRDQVENLIHSLFSAMFPKYYRLDPLAASGEQSAEAVAKYLLAALSFVTETEEEAQYYTNRILERLPEIKKTLLTDIQAAYEGDPAAKSTDEVALTYPAFTAITVYRVAHEFYLLQIPLIPRMMTEYAHRETGIDIHPGATIGSRFFIDHGTGVVIGETTVIGEHVKLYQHVTLGAKSFEVGDDGTLVKGIKRHPNIGNDVVIYAGATILGGTTTIGNGCVIGGNVWLTHSVPSGETVIANVAKERKNTANPAQNV
ncbi:MAG: serine acetyltransferase [Oscillospiraceae bacterium]|nr:serine acetyltransferase [Oscillospiraceae bacterium]